MGLFNRKPELQDQALSELAIMFSADFDDPTAGRELLDESKLDYSVESLGLVDDYLETMRQRELDDEALGKLALRCGAYVGEVIRRNVTEKTYHWLDYKGAAKLNPMIKDFGDSLGTAAVLWNGDSGFTFPIGKVLKYWENGSEDSVKFFAKVMIDQTNGKQ